MTALSPHETAPLPQHDSRAADDREVLYLPKKSTFGPEDDLADPRARRVADIIRSQARVNEQMELLPGVEYIDPHDPNQLSANSWRRTERSLDPVPRMETHLGASGLHEQLKIEQVPIAR